MVVTADETRIMRFFKDDPGLRRVAFTLKGYTIQGGDREKGYQRLDYLIHQRRIRVTRRMVDVGFGGAAGAASYFMATNTFSLGSTFRPDSTYGKALLAHEGAHALIDLQALGAVNRGVSEAIGYLAEAMWLHAGGWNPIGMERGGVDPVRQKAYDIAAALASAAGGNVPDKDADGLAGLIVSNKQYDDPSPHISDGIG